MLISQKEKIIFLTPPKTGGSSIYKCLIDSGIEVDTYAYRYLFLSEILDIFDINDIGGYKIFQVTRNPYTRFCSVYYNQIKVIKKIFLNGLDDMSLPEFTQHFLESLNSEGNFIDNFYGDREFIEGSIKPQKHWGGARGLLSQTQWNDLGLDVKFLKMETISKDMFELSNHLDIYLQDMELLNANPKNVLYEDILTPEIKDIVREIYTEDFKMLGYD